MDNIYLLRKPGPAARQKIRVDILKQNLDPDDLKNPFHEAVANNNLEIVSLIMETVAAEVRMLCSDWLTLPTVCSDWLGAEAGLWTALIVSADGEQDWQR